MLLALVLLSLAALMLAAAVELWWGSPLRRQQRQSLVHLEESLAPKMPSSSPTPGQAMPTRTGEWVTDALCLRAGLAPGWRVPAQLLAIGAIIAALGAWRIGSVWAVPLLLGTYAAVTGMWLRSRIEQQRQQLVRQLPDFLDAMVRLASIGNSLPMAFQTAAMSVQGPLRVVLDRTMQSVRSGLDLDRALQMASRPYRIDALDLLHVVLGTGLRMGGRADHILQRIGDFMRDLGHARQELRAITSETRMSAWVLGLLPIVVVAGMSLLSPDFFHPMFTHPVGHKLLLAALVLELLGGFLLYRLARSL